MGTISVLLAVLITFMLPFLDKLISYIYPKGILSQADEECHTIFDIGDCSKIPEVSNK